jgi:multimeric flavodoxin WrbA
MKITVINGSPRKGWNTDLLLHKAIEGAKSVGAEVEMVHLNDLDFRGCQSCLACKVKEGKSLGHCVVNDGLKPVLDKIDQSDGLILGSPINLVMLRRLCVRCWNGCCSSIRISMAASHFSRAS